MSADSFFMQRAFELAELGRDFVSPNPLVGCVIVRDQVVIAEGHHATFGGKHAEIDALEKLNFQAPGATLYVTLEPCCHFGKTPPCVQSVIQSGVTRVVIASCDPNPLVNGKGAQTLRDAGISVEIDSTFTPRLEKQNQTFFHFMRTHKPFVFAKWAMSLDGKTQTHPNDHRFISNANSHGHAHQLRKQVDAILIGAQTLRADNPELTARNPDGQLHPKQPLRIVLSKQCQIPLDAHVFNTEKAKTLLISETRINDSDLNALISKNVSYLHLPNLSEKKGVHDLLLHLGKMQISSLLVEGGMKILNLFFENNSVNQIQLYLAPTWIGQSPTKKRFNTLVAKNQASDLFITLDSSIPLAIEDAKSNCDGGERHPDYIANSN